MAYRPISIYLAGAIRDGRWEDVQWRETVINELPGAVIVNPLGAKQLEERSKLWTVAGIQASVDTIVPQDAWGVDNADLVLANLSSLAEGYPSIGTLIEVGRAWGRGKLIYFIIPPGFRGHGNEGMFRLHPFLQKIGAGKFVGVEEAIKFLKRYLPVLDGTNPHFDGVI